MTHDTRRTVEVEWEYADDERGLLFGCELKAKVFGNQLEDIEVTVLNVDVDFDVKTPDGEFTCAITFEANRTCRTSLERLGSLILGWHYDTIYDALLAQLEKEEAAA